jgi:hypothetical protein
MRTLRLHVRLVPSPEVASSLLRFIRHVAALLEHSRIVEVASGGMTQAGKARILREVQDFRPGDMAQGRPTVFAPCC